MSQTFPLIFLVSLKDHIINQKGSIATTLHSPPPTKRGGGGQRNNIIVWILDLGIHHNNSALPPPYKERGGRAEIVVWILDLGKIVLMDQVIKINLWNELLLKKPLVYSQRK